MRLEEQENGNHLVLGQAAPADEGVGGGVLHKIVSKMLCYRSTLARYLLINSLN